MLLWAGFVVDDIHDFSTQTEYLALFSSQVEYLYSPTTPGAYFWFPAEKTPSVATRWELSLASLQSGCNGTGLTSDGCGAYLPDGQVSQLVIFGGLASQNIPQSTFPSFGLDGNNINMS